MIKIPAPIQRGSELGLRPAVSAFISIMKIRERKDMLYLVFITVHFHHKIQPAVWEHHLSRTSRTKEDEIFIWMSLQGSILHLTSYINMQHCFHWLTICTDPLKGCKTQDLQKCNSVVEWFLFTLRMISLWDPQLLTALRWSCVRCGAALDPRALRSLWYDILWNVTPVDQRES